MVRECMKWQTLFETRWQKYWPDSVSDGTLYFKSTLGAHVPCVSQRDSCAAHVQDIPVTRVDKLASDDLPRERRALVRDSAQIFLA